MPQYELEPIAFPLGAAHDALVAGFEQATIYHSRAWWDFLRATQPITPIAYLIHEEGEQIGFLLGGMVRKGPLRMFGSPLPGWTTPYLGPVVRRVTAADRLTTAILERLHADRFAHYELRSDTMSWWTPPAVTRATALHSFEEPGRTIVAEVAADDAAILQSFSKSTRKTVRRAQRAGLEAQLDTAPSFLDDYYEQLTEVFAKRSLKPTYSRSRIAALIEHLRPTGSLLTTRVTSEGLSIATRIDLLDSSTMYSFGSASRQATLKLAPNELARYFVMVEAAKRGITTYNMTGGGDYKLKFNAEAVDHRRRIGSRPTLMAARSVYKFGKKTVRNLRRAA